MSGWLNWNTLRVTDDIMITGQGENEKYAPIDHENNRIALIFFLSCRYTNPIHCLTHSFATSL